MQFKEGNLQFTEELKFTDDYGRFSKAEMSNFSDPGNMENRKPDQKNFAPEKCTPTKKEQDFKEKDVDIVKNIDAESIVKENDLNPNDSVRLDDDGEKAVKALKDYILKELGNI